MVITRHTVAEKFSAYLRHDITLGQLVDWAESALMDGTLAEEDTPMLAEVISRIATADVQHFSLAWEDCEQLLAKLGYKPRIEVVAA